MKSPEGTVTLVPTAAVMIHVTIDTGRATKMPAMVDGRFWECERKIAHLITHIE